MKESWLTYAEFKSENGMVSEYENSCVVKKYTFVFHTNGNFPDEQNNGLAAIQM